MDLDVQKLLLDCGFKSAPPPIGARWAVVGEVDGGLALNVTCMAGPRGGYVVLVPSESERQILVDMLSQHGMKRVDVRAESMEPSAQWLLIGAGALVLFFWVLSSIPTF
jgi:hypothetical protein